MRQAWCNEKTKGDILRRPKGSINDSSMGPSSDNTPKHGTTLEGYDAARSLTKAWSSVRLAIAQTVICNSSIAFGETGYVSVGWQCTSTRCLNTSLDGRFAIGDSDTVLSSITEEGERTRKDPKQQCWWSVSNPLAVVGGYTNQIRCYTSCTPHYNVKFNKPWKHRYWSIERSTVIQVAVTWGRTMICEVYHRCLI